MTVDLNLVVTELLRLGFPGVVIFWLAWELREAREEIRELQDTARALVVTAAEKSEKLMLAQLEAAHKTADALDKNTSAQEARSEQDAAQTRTLQGVVSLQQRHDQILQSLYVTFAGRDILARQNPVLPAPIDPLPGGG